MTAEEIERLHDQVRAMAESLEEADNTRGNCMAAVCLRRAMYDIWGAFGYLAIEEGLLDV
jgi:hypothetical protein